MIKDAILARGRANTKITKSRERELRKRSERFSSLLDEDSKYSNSIRKARDLYFTDEVLEMSDELLQKTSNKLNRDRFVKISWDKRHTESYVTMSYMVAHPRVAKRINNGEITPYGTEIAMINYGDDDMDNRELMSAIEGSETQGVYEDTVSYYEEVNSLDYGYEPTTGEKFEMETMFEDIDAMFDMGIQLDK